MSINVYVYINLYTLITTDMIHILHRILFGNDFCNFSTWSQYHATLGHHVLLLEAVSPRRGPFSVCSSHTRSILETGQVSHYSLLTFRETEIHLALVL